MPVIDWNSTAAWLGIFVTLTISILTPAINTFLNNRYQLKLKRMELSHSEKSDLYSKKYYVYEGFMQNVGKCIQLHNRDNITAAGSFLYELYLYLPSEHWSLLDSLVENMNVCNWESAHPTFIQICKLISTELTTLQHSQECVTKSRPSNYFTNNRTS